MCAHFLLETREEGSVELPEVLTRTCTDNKLVQWNLCLQNYLAHISVFPRVINQP